MTRLSHARYRARFAETAGDLRAARRLRHRVFIDGTGAVARAGGEEADRFDDTCRHVVIEAREGGDPVACFRMMEFPDGRAISTSYTAEFYRLHGLESYPRPMLELGRFCIAPGGDRGAEADILRIAWATLTRIVDEGAVGLLFGCSSFRGCEAGAYRDAFALLQARHLAPARWRPGRKSSEIHTFASGGDRPPDPRAALRQMPPLLRGYLAMGGWVGDHAVIDRDLGTLHVFTGLEVAAIPAARTRALRRAAA